MNGRPLALLGLLVACGSETSPATPDAQVPRDVLSAETETDDRPTTADGVTPDDRAAPDVTVAPDVMAAPDGTAAPDAVVAPDVTAAPVLDRVFLYLNLGDSVGAGRNAMPQAERGYSALLFRNAGYPSYAGADIATRWPGAMRVDRARSGWTTTDVANDLRGAIGALPRGADGDDTVVTISAGGNDFNDSPTRIVARAATETAANAAVANLTEVYRSLRARYHDPTRGRVLVILQTNVHDPTDGTGRVPDGFPGAWCRALSSPLVIPFRMAAVDNLGYFNGRIAAAASASGALLVDSHRVFLGHGMSAPGDARWIDGDCIHPLNEGHHQLRREAWRVLTGEAR